MLPSKLLLRETQMKALPASSLSGTWTSTHCETRPGPEFILRRYIFDPSTSSNASFSVFGVIYHYADPSCSAPLQAVTFSGQITSSNSSVLVPGAMSSEFLLQHAWLRYYMSEVAMKAEKKIEQNCGELGSSTEIDYPVYTDGGSQECLEALNLSFWELQLFRLEQKREILKGRKPHQPRLFLGDIHTTPKMRRRYRPTSYQPDYLSKYSTKHHTLHARLVHGSSPDNPPTLVPLPHIPVTHTSLMGTWHSANCEVRPHSLFLIRKIIFLHDNMWQASFTFFLDHFCSNPHFSVNVSGRYIKGKRHLII